MQPTTEITADSYAVTAPPPAATSEREYLLDEYKKASAQTPVDQHLLARLEERLWEAASAEERKSAIRRDWLAKQVGGLPSQYEKRGALLFAGVAANPLWERVAGGMTIGVACRILRDAKWLQKTKNTTLALAVLNAIAEFEAAPVRNNGTRVALKRGPLRVDYRRVHQPRPPEKRSTSPVADSRRFWQSMREQIFAYMQKQASEVDPFVIERLTEEFMKELRVLTDAWSGKIKRAASTETTEQVIRRVKVVAACRVLAINPPQPGKLVDLALANKNKKAFAKVYHPDTGNEDPVALERYQAVFDAYDTLESYNKQQAKK